MKKNILKRLYIKLSNVTELKYSIPLDIKNMRNLIVAPHPDDELFGCFGVLNDYSCHNDILLVTDGEKGISDLPEEKTRLVRNREFIECCSNLNVANIDFAHLPDSNLNLKILNENIVTEKLKYDNIFLPNILDLHPDHYMCSRFFLGAKSLKNKKNVEMGSHPTVLSNSLTNNYARRVRNVMGPLQTPKKPVKK